MKVKSYIQYLYQVRLRKGNAERVELTWATSSSHAVESIRRRDKDSEIVKVERALS